METGFNFRFQTDSILTFPFRLSLSEGVRLGRVDSRPSPERCERSDQREAAEGATASDASPLADFCFQFSCPVLGHPNVFRFQFQISFSFSFRMRNRFSKRTRFAVFVRNVRRWVALYAKAYRATSASTSSATSTTTSTTTTTSTLTSTSTSTSTVDRTNRTNRTLCKTAGR